MSTPPEPDPAPSDVPGALVDACGDDPGRICEWVFDRTDGNKALAGIADWLVDRPLQILLVLVVAWIVTRIARRWVRGLVRRVVDPDHRATVRHLRRLGVPAPPALTGEVRDPRRTARARSISAVTGSTLSVLVWTIALITVVGIIGIDLAPLIAGAGIAGVALGFGAQSLVKDCLSGLFMLLEDQYGIGDVVDLGEAVGVVEEISLRATVLRGLDGTVWHVPNGEVTRVGNLSQLWSVAVLDVVVSLRTDLDEARRVLLDTAADVCADDDVRDGVLEPPEILGVETLGPDGITLRMIVKVKPGTQWALQRRLREAVKAAFEAEGIEIPLPQRTIWMRGEPEAASSAGPDDATA